MIHILYLAAGRGARFGSNKLLHPLEGKPLFRHGLDRLLAITARREETALTVVSRYPEILSYARERGAKAVDSLDSEKGVSHTIRAGLQALPPLSPADFLLFVVADQPWLRADTLEAMLSAARPGLLGATAAFGERVGNPTLFSAPLVPELLALEGDQGGRKVLHRHREACLLVQVSRERELWDIDRRDQLP